MTCEMYCNLQYKLKRSWYAGDNNNYYLEIIVFNNNNNNNNNHIIVGTIRFACANALPF